MQRQPRLADAATPADRGDRHRPAGVGERVQRGVEHRELGGAADEPGGRRGQLAGDRDAGRGLLARCVERWGGGEHLLVQQLEAGTRVGAQLVGEAQPDPLVALQRLGLPPAAVEGEEELAGQPLVERVLLGAGGELGEQGGVLPAPQLRVVEVELGGEPFGVQRLPRAGRPRGVQPGDGRPLPQPQRIPEQVRGRAVVGVVRFRGEPAEPVEIDHVVVDVCDVPAGPVADLAAGRSQPGQVGAQRRDGPRGRVLAPDPLGERGRGDDPVRVDQQGGQHVSLPGGTEVDGAAVVAGRDRTQHPELHLTSLRRPEWTTGR